jgi:fructose-1,6-bisphosphatase/inositol monophosphatase family enzyme
MFHGRMKLVDPDRVAAIMREVAQTIILPRFQKLATDDVREKRPGDLVTVADTEAEHELTRRLAELLPGSRVVGEESAAADPGVLDRLEGDGPVWIIDPVDGTGNFAHGRAGFAVIVGLVSGGETVQGWIHDPLADDTAMAERGEGCWMSGRRLRVSAEGPLSAMVGAAGLRRNERVGRAVVKLLRHGCIAQDYLGLVEGRMQFAYFRRLHPWDHAAGVLLHHEAGGYSALMDGSPYRPLPSTQGLLLAPGRKSWDALAPLVTQQDQK